MLEPLPVVSPSFLAEAARPRGVSGKLAVPVDPSRVVYARFRHVVGVSASGPGDAVPLLKLRVLDNLIHNYLVARGESSLGPNGADTEVPIAARSVDATIAALGADLHAALASKPAAFRGAVRETGGVLSVGA